MLLELDPFIACVAEAQRRLAHIEGRDISVRELARRAGIPESTLGNILRPNRDVKTRRIRADRIRALARVLPVSEEVLMRAAQAAAGLSVDDAPRPYPDPAEALTAMFRSDATAEERLAMIAAVQAQIAVEMGNLSRGLHAVNGE